MRSRLVPAALAAAAALALLAAPATPASAATAPLAPRPPAASVRPQPVLPPPPPAPAPAPFVDRYVQRIATTDPVVFITIDDGLYEDPELLQFLTDQRIPVTAFLTTGTIVHWPYWKGLEPMASIQNHTVTHTSLPKAADPASEICGANEAIVEQTGQVPWMLRPPYGAYNASTLAAAGHCGLDWVVHWSVSLPGKTLEYQTKKQALEPGDIILTHFRADLLPALRKAVKDIRRQGFEVARLEDYLLPRGVADRSVGELPEMAMATQTESRAVLIPGA